MNAEEMKRRTMDLGLGVIRFVREMERNQVTEVIGRQLLRSGTSVGANYRAACRAKSRVDFIAKLKVVEEELDEVMCWLELLVASRSAGKEESLRLSKQADELLAIVVSSIHTARKRVVRAGT